MTLSRELLFNGSRVPCRRRPHDRGPLSLYQRRVRHGGGGLSGYGRFGGDAAVDAFTELRWLTIQHGHQIFPF
jgi:hypothetical protein